MDRSPLFDLAIQIGRIHAEQYRSPLMRRPDASVLQGEADRCERAVGLIERARDCVRDAIKSLDEAAKLSSASAVDCAEAGEELRAVLHDGICGNALYVAREAADETRRKVEDHYPQDDLPRAAAE